MFCKNKTNETRYHSPIRANRRMVGMRGGFAPIFIALIVAAILVLGGGVFYYAKITTKPVQVACPMEAKQCPDGSYVGRVGPNCEFAACPKVAQKPASAPLDCINDVLVKRCPDGSLIIAYSNCEFPACPAKTSAKAPGVNPFPATTTTTIDTSGWKKYWNLKYAFGFLYPADHTPYSDVDTGLKTLVRAVSSSDSVSIAEDESEIFSGASAVLRISVINEDMNINTWIDQNLSRYAGNAKITRRNIILGGHVAVQITPQAGSQSPQSYGGQAGQAPTTGQSFHKITVIQPGNYFIVVAQTGASTLLDTVFSTFSFLRN